jgi:hypothetical protein
MPLADYPDLSWLIRAVRVLPVVAVAASVGGVIGGFTVFAIDSALTWQPRPDLRADNQATEQQQAPKSIRIVGGAIPDPSAGMLGPPPAQPQPRAASAQSPAPQVPAQLLTAKPLGAAQPLTQTKTQAQTPQAQTPPAAAQPVSNQTPIAAATQQQSTRWPDALSRAHPGTGAQQQTQAPQPNATPERSASKNSDADRKNVGGERAGNEQAASASDEDRAGASRRGRHGRRRTMMSDVPRSGAGDDTDMSSARGAERRLDARAYNRVYNSYGGAREDDPERAASSRSSRQRRYGSDERYYGRRGAIVREGPNQADQAPVSEAAQPRGEPFWGGGFMRRDDRVRGSQDEGD